MGLTRNQAKVYLSLLSLDFLSVNEIHRIVRIPRHHIYRTLNELKELGLLEHTFDRPQKFKGIPIEQAFSFLVKQRKHEIYKMEKEIVEIINNNHLNSNDKFQENKPNFVLLSKKEASIQKRRNEIENAKKSIDFITSWKRFPLTIWTFGDIALKALKRNVQIRVILEKPKKIKELPKEVENCKKFSNYQIRFITNPPKAIIGVFDKKTAIVKTSSNVGLAEAPSVWTTNPCFVSIISDYFETNWKTAMEYMPENIAAIQ